MQGFGHADGGHVAVALIGEDHGFRPGAAHARGHGAGASVRGFKAVHVEVVIGKGGAAHCGHKYGAIRHAQFVQYLAHQPVGYAVVAAGAIVGLALVEHGIYVKNQSFALLRQPLGVHLLS